MGRFRIILFCLILSNAVKANTHSLEFKKNTVTFTPTTLVHFMGKPGIELGYERLINERLGICTEFSLVRDLFNLYDPFNFSSNFKGASVGLSIKIYSKPFKIIPIFGNQPEPAFRLFASPGFYFNHNSRLQNHEFMRTDSSSYMDLYTIVRNETAYFLDIGLRDNNGRFIAEFAIGLGYVMRNTSHVDRENLNDNFTLAAGEYFLFEHEPAQRYNLPMIRFKMSFGYRF